MNNTIDWQDQDNIDLLTEELERVEHEIKLLLIYKQMIKNALLTQPE